MIKFYYCKYYRTRSGRLICINEDEIVSGPRATLDGGYEVVVSSGYTFHLTGIFPEKVEREMTPPTANELKLGLRGEYFFNRTFPILEPTLAQ